MKLTSSLRLRVAAVLLVAGTALSLRAASVVIDNFANADHTPAGAPRFVVDDKAAGSQSHATLKCEHGVLSVEGELVPGRGRPAFISVPLLLSPNGAPQDLSSCEGVRIGIRLHQGMISVQVASADITNYDYHTGGPLAAPAGEFQELRVPFKDMKRGWSEQTPLNLRALTSVNLVAFGLAKGNFSYEVSEIAFY